MTGLLALVGGREHTPGCEPFDAALLAAVRSPRPVVTVVPFASSRRTAARTVGVAVAWWEWLGADVVVAPPSEHDAIGAVAVADVITLTGGVPDRLSDRLARPRLWETIRARWRAGAHLSGSSSGAMVLGQWRQSVRPPFDVQPGLGLVAGVAVAPHHELPLPRLVAAARSRTHPHILIVGIDERTALVGRDGTFDVLGAGSVVLRRGAWQRHLAAGARLTLPGAATPAPTTSVPRPSHV